MSKLKSIQRLKLVLPVRNVALIGDETLTNSIRKVLHNFFLKEPDEDNLLETLSWLIFEKYQENAKDEWILSRCPRCEKNNVSLIYEQMSEEYTFNCKKCGGLIYLTDVFRLYEVVDDEIGAGGILSYVVSSFEQIIICTSN